MVQELREEKLVDPKTAKQLFSKKWVIYSKKPFFGPKQVIEYLGRYSHKIAISNQRIKSLLNGKVNFTVKNYRNHGKKETCTLKAPEFLRRFSLHNLSRASGFYPRALPESGITASWQVLSRQHTKSILTVRSVRS